MCVCVIAHVSFSSKFECHFCDALDPLSPFFLPMSKGATNLWLIIPEQNGPCQRWRYIPGLYLRIVVGGLHFQNYQNITHQLELLKKNSPIHWPWFTLEVITTILKMCSNFGWCFQPLYLQKKWWHVSTNQKGTLLKNSIPCTLKKSDLAGTS